MTAVVSVFVVVTIGFLITRVGSVMLAHTGMSTDSARFQARSAFLGVGYTTSEAESVVDHPARRRIVMALMWLGNAGIVTVVGTLILTFTAGGGSQPLLRAAILVVGMSILLLIARSSWLDRRLSAVIDRVLRRWTDLDVRDYAALLHLSEDYRIFEVLVQEGDWVAGRRLGEMVLRDEGIAVLGVLRRHGRYIGAPHGGTLVRPGDMLLLYGREERICELDKRASGPEGDEAHRRAVAEQAALAAEEHAQDPAD